ncbi:putative molybdenum carrier protein [Spirosoma daeguense]
MTSFKVKQIVSGGQTGIDQLGLEIAHALGFKTGGVAPKVYLTENGPNSSLPTTYGLTEHESANYPPRTKSNVQQSDGTVVFGDVIGGTTLTVHECRKADKPCVINPTADTLRDWLIEHQIEVLNVAGSRGSRLGFEQLHTYRQILYDVLTTNQRLAILFRKEPLQW